jgi:hypothetical protein
MKSYFILLSALFLLGCKKDPAIITKEVPVPTPAAPVIDERDSVTGNYAGIKIDAAFSFTTFGWTYDTTNITMKLTKSSTDSIVDVAFSNQLYAYKYHNNMFTGMIPDPPSLTKSNDSLYFRHEPGPVAIEWTECRVKKQ